MEKNSNKIVSKSDLDVLPTQDLQTTVWSDEEDETQVVTKINDTVEHFLKVPKESNLPLGKKQLKKKMKKVKFETTAKPEIGKISQQVVAEVHRSQDSEGQEDHDAIMQEQRYAKLENQLQELLTLNKQLMSAQQDLMAELRALRKDNEKLVKENEELKSGMTIAKKEISDATKSVQLIQQEIVKVQTEPSQKEEITEVIQEEIPVKKQVDPQPSCSQQPVIEKFADDGIRLPIRVDSQQSSKKNAEAIKNKIQLGKDINRVVNEGLREVNTEPVKESFAEKLAQNLKKTLTKVTYTFSREKSQVAKSKPKGMNIKIWEKICKETIVTGKQIGRAHV